MSSTSRNRIISRLNAAPRDPSEPLSESAPKAVGAHDIEEKICRLKQQMEAMRTEVHVVDDGCWVEALAEIVRMKGLASLLYSPWTEMGAALEKFWRSSENLDEKLPELVSYDGDVEDLQQRLFSMEGAITTSKGAIADAGAIILWPDEKEPRLMSLVPPVHIAVLNANTVCHTLSEIMEKDEWHDSMPTNVVLISGPSKTADIELTLAFGVHGPKELILFIVTNRIDTSPSLA